MQEHKMTLTCPCPDQGLRCHGCMMPVLGITPPFRATPLGWTLATLARVRHRTIS